MKNLRLNTNFSKKIDPKKTLKKRPTGLSDGFLGFNIFLGALKVCTKFPKGPLKSPENFRNVEHLTFLLFRGP